MVGSEARVEVAGEVVGCRSQRRSKNEARGSRRTKERQSKDKPAEDKGSVKTGPRRTKGVQEQARSPKTGPRMVIGAQTTSRPLEEFLKNNSSSSLKASFRDIFSLYMLAYSMKVLSQWYPHFCMNEVKMIGIDTTSLPQVNNTRNEQIIILLPVGVIPPIYAYKWFSGKGVLLQRQGRFLKTKTKRQSRVVTGLIGQFKRWVGLCRSTVAERYISGYILISLCMYLHTSIYIYSYQDIHIYI